jgi:hypothetical protein
MPKLGLTIRDPYKVPIQHHFAFASGRRKLLKSFLCKDLLVSRSFGGYAWRQR